mmetsp:Transcript_17517/g.34196  ORF Transcript_17517/g.34196 Transcript_17517/m.34196 type:complete len:238 (+) Transcript_17517:1457-2170(+)
MLVDMSVMLRSEFCRALEVTVCHSSMCSSRVINAASLSAKMDISLLRLPVIFSYASSMRSVMLLLSSNEALTRGSSKYGSRSWITLITRLDETVVSDLKVSCKACKELMSCLFASVLDSNNSKSSLIRSITFCRPVRSFSSACCVPWSSETSFFRISARAFMAVSFSVIEVSTLFTAFCSWVLLAFSSFSSSDSLNCSVKDNLFDSTVTSLFFCSRSWIFLACSATRVLSREILLRS